MSNTSSVWESDGGKYAIRGRSVTQISLLSDAVERNDTWRSESGTRCLVNFGSPVFLTPCIHFPDGIHCFNNISDIPFITQMLLVMLLVIMNAVLPVLLPSSW